MAESTTTCKECWENIKVEVKDELIEETVTITDHLITCNKCKVEIYEAPQLYVPNETFIKKEIKEEIVEDHSVSFNEDVLVCIEKRILYCYQCNYGTNNKQILTDHVFAHRFKCNQCTYTSPDNSMLIIHQRIHFDIEPQLSQISGLQCFSCGYSSNNEITLKLHVKTCSNGKKLYKCNLCNYQNNQSQLLKNHMLDKHPYCCDKCNYKTPFKSYLNRHKKVHSQETPFKCDLCDFTSKYSQNLKAHTIKHFNEPKLSCDKCDYKTYTKNLLMQHKAVHSEEKPFKCNLCDFTCKHAHSLKFHSNKHLVHSEDKPFKCKLCEFATNRSEHLKLHSKKHLAEPNYRCDKCDFKTYVKYRLIRHIECVHSGVRPFKCDLCEFTCKTSDYLKVHVNKHLNERKEHKYSCGKCDYKTNSKWNLSNHKSVHLEEKPFRCSLCDFSCKRSGDLKKHLNLTTKHRLKP